MMVFIFLVCMYVCEVLGVRGGAHDCSVLCPAGEVLEQSSGTGQYVIEWADRTTQVQEITHMFGKLTKKRGLRQGDHVLALAVLSMLFIMLIILI